MSPKVNIVRHLVQVGERVVHYRKAGSGPPIVLIHQSPKSSAELIDMIGQLASNFTVFAPDTPGYGYSDPLDQIDADIDHFVDALVALIDTLGLTKPALFGSHSGAIFGVRLAVRYPQKLSALIANGILINDQATRDELILRYFPDYRPDWEGSHLPRVWSRIRDQHCFYPWYKRQPETRIHWASTLEQMHDSAMEVLRAQEHYKTGYRAVLDYNITPDLAALSVPTLLVVAKGDALVQYVSMYPVLAKTTEVRVVPDFSDIAPQTATFATRFAVGSVIAKQAKEQPITSSQVGRRLFTHCDCALHYYVAGNAKNEALLLLHDIGQSAAQYLCVITALSKHYYVIAPDLPGHGYSDTMGADAQIVTGYIRALTADLGVKRFSIVSVGESSGYGGLLTGLPCTTIQNHVCCTGNNAQVDPDLTIDYAGTQLLKAWYHERDKLLFSDVSQRQAQTIKTDACELSLDVINRQVLDRLVSREVIPSMRRELRMLTSNAQNKINTTTLNMPADTAHWYQPLCQALG